MKHLTIILLSIFCLAIAQPVQAQNKKAKDVAQVTFVTDIDCPNCVKKVEAKLPFEKGIKNMKVNLEDKTIWIEYQPSKTNTEALIKAIEKLGYSAKVKEEPKK